MPSKQFNKKQKNGFISGKKKATYVAQIAQSILFTTEIKY